jgi:hypothetical protein
VSCKQREESEVSVEPRIPSFRSVLVRALAGRRASDCTPLTGGFEQPTQAMQWPCECASPRLSAGRTRRAGGSTSKMSINDGSCRAVPCVCVSRVVRRELARRSVWRLGHWAVGDSDRIRDRTRPRPDAIMQLSDRVCSCAGVWCRHGRPSERRWRWAMCRGYVIAGLGCRS